MDSQHSSETQVRLKTESTARTVCTATESLRGINALDSNQTSFSTRREPCRRCAEHTPANGRRPVGATLSDESRDVSTDRIVEET